MKISSAVAILKTVDSAPAADTDSRAAKNKKKANKANKGELICTTPTSTRRFLLLVLLVLVVCCFACGPVWRWIEYRCTHVLTDEARVKGVVSLVGSRLEGRIRTVEVRAGQQVMRGDLLARLEDAHLRARVGEARGELAKARAELALEERAIEETRRQLNLRLLRQQLGLETADAEMRVAEAELKKSEAQYRRAANLASQQMASRQVLEDTATAREASRATLSAAAKAREAAEVDRRATAAELKGLEVREAGLEVLVARVEIARSRLDSEEANLQASAIRAPDDGWVVRRLIEPGASVDVGEPIVSLWIGDGIWVEGWVEEKHLSRIREGGQADVMLDAYPDKVFRGRVEGIGVLSSTELENSVVPRALGTIADTAAWINVRVVLEDAHTDLFPGLSAVVAILKEPPADLSSRPKLRVHVLADDKQAGPDSSTR